MKLTTPGKVGCRAKILKSPEVRFLVNFYMNFATFAIPFRLEIG